jgi:two-component system, NarL family, nitrate/nitrite response regulator NarL
VSSLGGPAFRPTRVNRDHSGRIRVLVADDHPLYREAVVRAVRARAEFELIGQAEDGRAALSVIRESSPDIAVLDVQMPSLGGVEVVRAVARDGLTTRVVLLSAHLEADTVYAAVVEGVRAYLSKSWPAERICDALVAVSRGEVILPEEVQSGLAAAIRSHALPSRPTLSPREHEVLGYIAQGLSAPAIAERLHVSPATVKTHLKTLYEKLGVSDRAAAVAEAMRRGLIE